jgi:hypothetical protein
VKVVCPYCGTTVQARPPAGGDGSGLRPHKHYEPDGEELCRGSFTVLDAGEALPT